MKFPVTTTTFFSFRLVDPISSIEVTVRATWDFWYSKCAMHHMMLRLLRHDKYVIVRKGLLLASSYVASQKNRHNTSDLVSKSLGFPISPRSCGGNGCCAGGQRSGGRRYQAAASHVVFDETRLTLLAVNTCGSNGHHPNKIQSVHQKCCFCRIEL